MSFVDDTQASATTDHEPARTAVALDGVGKQFNDLWAVRDLDLYVEPGTILGLIGPSGCGKTTTVRLITGMHAPDEGQVRVFGDEPSELDSGRRYRLGYLPQHEVLFPSLSLWENLQYHASLNGVRMRGRSARLRELLALVDLDGQERTTARDASGGMRRRTALAAALVHAPDLLLLDEPTAGVDPILRRRFWDRFRELRDEGRTLVITTQYVGEAADCDQVALLSHGRLLRVGSPAELKLAAAGVHGGAPADVDDIDLSWNEVFVRLVENDGGSDHEPRTLRTRPVPDRGSDG